MVYSVISTPGFSRGGEGGGTPSNMSLDPTAAAARKKITALTEGRADELGNDPYQKSAMDYLKGTISGQNVPYSNGVKNSILAQHGAGAASAEAAQMETLRQSLGASGGSIYDPGYQAAQREAMSQRQGSNLDAMGQLEAKAGLANQQAQAQAASALSSARAQQNAQINAMKLAGADYQAKTQVPVGAGAAGGGGAYPVNAAGKPIAMGPRLTDMTGRPLNSMTYQNQAAMRL
jgi:hypothetical protein